MCTNAVGTCIAKKGAPLALTQCSHEAQGQGRLGHQAQGQGRLDHQAQGQGRLDHQAQGQGRLSVWSCEVPDNIISWTEFIINVFTIVFLI